MTDLRMDVFSLRVLGVDPEDVSLIIKACQSTRLPNGVVLIWFTDLLRNGVPVIDVLAAATLVRSGLWGPEFLLPPSYQIMEASLQFAATRLVVAVGQFARAIRHALPFQAKV